MIHCYSPIGGSREYHLSDIPSPSPFEDWRIRIPCGKNVDTHHVKAINTLWNVGDEEFAAVVKDLYREYGTPDLTTRIAI